MDPEDRNGPQDQETRAAAVEETIVRAGSERPDATRIAVTAACGAAVLALVVPVFSGGIDPATGIVLLAVLFTPVYLHAAVRRNARRGYSGRATGYAVAALVVSIVFAIIMFVAIGGNKPLCIDRGVSCGDLAQSAAQQATSTCFTVSVALYALSGSVGLFAPLDDRVTA